MNTPVDFENALSLKELGFDEECSSYYAEQHGLKDNVLVQLEPILLFNRTKQNRYRYQLCSAPTVAEVCMWLYEKYGVWISVERPDPKGLFNFVIVYQDEIAVKESRGKGYTNPTEAYSEAIKYCLTKLL